MDIEQYESMQPSVRITRGGRSFIYMALQEIVWVENGLA